MRTTRLAFVHVASVALAALLAACSGASDADGAGSPATVSVRVAVAANAAAALHALETAFEAQHGDVDVELSIGSTGGLYAQIAAGAPFDVFVAADRERPARLLDDGVARASTTYAHGRLALVGAVGAASGDPRADLVSALSAPSVEHLAVANPRTAPYGVAALEVLDALALRAAFEGRTAFGADVGQAHTFVVTGAAEVGFVALAQARARADERFLAVPPSLHASIRQDAVLLADGEAARAFYAFLGSDAARRAFADAGYDLPSRD